MDSEAYMLVTTASQHQNYEDYAEVKSGKSYDLNVYLQAALRRQYPELALTVTLASNGISIPSPFLPLPILIRQSSSADMVCQSISWPSHLPATRPPPSISSTNPSSAHAISSRPPPLANPAHSPNTFINGATSTLSCISYKSATMGRSNIYSKSLWKGRRSCRVMGRRMS